MKKARIIIVEDESIIAVNLKEAVESLGYDVHAIVPSGEEAIEKAEQLKPDLILMDIVLSDKMDGIDAAKIIMERFKIPVIYLTAHSDKMTLERAKATEPYGYVLKPINPQELYVTIEVGLYKHGMERKLKESEENYRAIFNGTNEAIFIHQVDSGKIMDVNQTMLDMYGMSHEEALNTTIEDLSSGDSSFTQEGAVSLIKKAVEEGPQIFEWRSKRKNGEFFWSEVTLKRAVIGGEERVMAVVRDITDRKLAEDALQESEERYRILVETMNDGVCIIDANGLITYINDKFSSQFGYPYEEIFGRQMLEFFNEKNRRILMEQFDRRQRGEDVPYELEWNLKDGGTLYSIVSPRGVFDEDGVFQGSLVVITDITDRKRAEEKLRESEERYRLIVENMPVLICRFLPENGIITFVNDEYCKYFKKSYGELVGHSFLELIPESGHQEVRDHFESLNKDNRVITYEYQVNTPDGVRWQRWIDQALFDEYDNVIEYQSIGMDITDRRLAEEALREERDRAQTYLDVVRAIIVVMDPEARATLINRRGCEVLGYSEDEVLGKNMIDHFIPEREQALIRKGLAEIVAGRVHMGDYYENHVLTKDGEERIILWNNAVLRDRDGNLISIISSGEDITERKQAEKRIRESELRYRELFENMSSGVAVYRPENDGEDFIFLDFNKAGERIEDIKKKDIVGKSVLQVFPGVRDFGLFEVFQRVYRTGDAESHPVSMYRDDRIMGWRDNYVYKLPTGEIVAIYDDVTQRMQMEYERNRVYLELDQIFNTTSVGMCLIDREFTITKANKTFLAMFDLKMGDVIGNKCYSIWKEHRCNLDSCPLTRVLDGHTPYKFEVRRERDGKDDIICMVSAVSYLSNDGEIVGVLESFTDITEVRELEKQIIGISQKERRSIGQDLHDDLGQKLSYIGFLAELVKRKMAEQTYDVDDIDEIIHLVGDSIDNIRSVSKGLHPVEMNPHGFIAAIEELAESTERLLGVSCELDKGGDLHIDDNNVATNLYYIVQESINNAIKHGKAKNIRIQVKSADNRLNLMVEDDGSGAQNEEVIGKGMGLRIMQYRADLIGAEFEARGSEKGFSVWVGLKRGM